MAVETLAPPQARLFTADEVWRMVEVGILGPDERVELIEGELIRMSPQDVLHVKVVAALTRSLINAYPEPFLVAAQSTIAGGQMSLPEPDLYVTPQLLDRHANLGETLLLVEVAVTTLRFDTGRKAALYARQGAPCYWVVDVRGRRVLVHEEPGPDGTFGSIRDVREGSLALPGVSGSLALEAIFRPIHPGTTKEGTR